MLQTMQPQKAEGRNGKKKCLPTPTKDASHAQRVLPPPSHKEAAAIKAERENNPITEIFRSEFKRPRDRTLPGPLSGCILAARTLLQRNKECRAARELKGGRGEKN